MKTLFVFLFVCISGSIVLAQSDTINRYDEKGEKHGYWKVFLDKSLGKCDSAGHAYYAYENYVHGFAAFRFYANSHSEKTTIQFTPDANYSDSNRILSGTFLFYRDGNELFSKEIYLNGHPHLLQSVYYSNDSIVPFETLDFSKRYHNEPGTFFYSESHSLGGHLETGWFRKGKNGWKTYYHKDSLNFSKYPYIDPYTPPLMGIILGYDFLNSPAIEGGIYVNIAEGGDIGTGIFAGPYLTYQKNLGQNIQCVTFGLGFYTPLTLQLDLNYHYGLGDRFLGFKPSVGTTLFNVQFLYGYNLFNNRKNENLQISHHSLTARIYIPVKKFKYYMEE